jgi:type II secretory pathway component GspD/PulD (secretin)
MQLDAVRVADVARIVYGDMLKKSYVLDDDVLRGDQLVSLSWSNMSKSEVERQARSLLNLRGYEVVQQGRVALIRVRDKRDEGILIYEPRNRSARYLADILVRVADARQLGTRGLSSTPSQQAAIAKQPEFQGSASSQVDRSALDQMAYQCMPKECERLRGLLVQLDTPEAQVILRAAVYEVGTTRGEGSALQIAGKLLQGQLTAAAGVSIAGASSFHLTAANLDAVVSVLDQDGRFKSVSRPMLRVRTGQQARFSVGQQVPVLGSVSLDKNGNAVQSVEYRQSGTIFTVQPDVRADVVDLNVTQELSSFVNTTTGVNNSPTLLQRTANSQLSIKAGEVVVFAGLEEAREDDSTSHLFGIPLAGQQSRTTSEVLLFIEAQRI